MSLAHRSWTLTIPISPVNSYCRVQPGIWRKTLRRKGIRLHGGKWVFEVRPPGFMKKLWLGTFEEEWEALIARDVYTAHCEVKPICEDFNFIFSPDWPTDNTLIEAFKSLHPECNSGQKQGKPHCLFAEKMKKRIKWTIKREKEGLVINPATGEVIVLYGEVFSVLREDIRDIPTANSAHLAPVTTTVDEVLAEGGGLPGFGIIFDDITLHGGAQNVHIGCTLDAPLKDSREEGN